jgi:hypothetical protein
MGSREDRRGRNEALFREVNEQIAELGERHRASQLEIVCECSRFDCTAPISVSVVEYEEARADPRTFIVCDGHEDPAVERTVVQHGDHVLVRKIGDAADAAIATDPR